MQAAMSAARARSGGSDNAIESEDAMYAQHQHPRSIHLLRKTRLSKTFQHWSRQWCCPTIASATGLLVACFLFSQPACHPAGAGSSAWRTVPLGSPGL